MEYFNATDIYITPYLNASQITSGTLAYSFGCGKAIIATPYWHAEELLSNGHGILVPFETARLLPASLSRCLKTTNVETRCVKRPICLGAPWFGTKWHNVF